MEMGTFEEVRSLIANKLALSEDEIKSESRLADDLNADSLDLADLVMAVEDKYGVDFANEDTDQFKTVGDVVKAIERLKGEA